MQSFSGDKLFNKWHKERLMQTIITKDTFKEVPNERYFQVSYGMLWQDIDNFRNCKAWVCSKVAEMGFYGLRGA